MNKETKWHEIHITGDEKIHEIAPHLGLRTIEIELLRPDGSILRTEHMTSDVRKFECFEQALDFVGSMRFGLIVNGVKVIRTKIECPPNEKQIDTAYYCESHFPVRDLSVECPISRRKNTNKLLGTARTFNKDLYRAFIETYKDKEIELCLHDSHVDEDKDWMELWGA
jgi:hypothetical protein